MNLVYILFDKDLKKVADQIDEEDLKHTEQFFYKLTHITWDDILNFLPVLLACFVILSISYFLANLLSKWFSRFLKKRLKSKNVLVANFFGNVVWAIIILIGVSMVFYLLGFGKVSTALISVGALSTFVVSFALRDIFENFLSGLILALDPPFELGNLVEIKDFKGEVTDMSLRETKIKTNDGIDIFIPNSILLKNPLQNYTIDDYLRKEFKLSISFTDNTEKALQLIHDTLVTIPDILNEAHHRPKIEISEVNSGSVVIVCKYWLNDDTASRSKTEIKNDAIIKVGRVLTQNGFQLPSGIVDVHIVEN